MKTLTIFSVLLINIFPANNLLRAQGIGAAPCYSPTAKTELNIANVRATILCGGDMWWDAMASIGPEYEVPNGSGKHSLFAGGLWIGGVDATNNLHIAAQTYRQQGNEFWPGPLDTLSASINSTICNQYNKLWKLTKQEVLNFIGGAPAVNAISTWPGNGSGNQAHYLAPYYDVNGDGNYNYADGDYPDFGFVASTGCCDILHGDQVIWWVINDAGNTHTETGGSQLGVEIRCQAFAYASSDIDISNTTFYQYQLINRSSNTYGSSYFGLFADVDLGYYHDDYIGCDVPRGLGYCYNGYSYDNGPTGYGLNPPAVGIDFLSGATADFADGIDNNRNCIVDEFGEEIIMSNFHYWTNGAAIAAMGNPYAATDYYNYLRSIWKDSVHVTYGGNGKGTGTGATNIPCNFMFPASSDHQYEWGTGGNCTTPAPAQADWSEIIAGNLPDDRRFLMSAGPFTFSPGAAHCVTAAVVWARDTSGAGPFYSLAALQTADDKAQLLFDNCFGASVVGIIESESLQADIFPNPVDNMLEVQLKNMVLQGNFSIYDVTGKIVKHINLKQQKKFTVSCKDLSSGIYVYRILLPDGKTTGGKFIKQ